MGPKSLVAFALVALAVAGCGSDSSSSTTTQDRKSSIIWPQADILRLSGIRRNATDLSYRIPGHPDCATTTLLRSSAEVQTYKNAGDVVVTNPDGSAGAKVTGESAACQKLFAQAMSHVR